METLKRHRFIVLLVVGCSALAQAEIMEFPHVSLAYRASDRAALSYREQLRVQDEVSGEWRTPTSEEISNKTASLRPAPLRLENPRTTPTGGNVASVNGKIIVRIKGAP